MLGNKEQVKEHAASTARALQELSINQLVRSKLNEFKILSPGQVTEQLLKKNAKNQTLIDLIVKKSDSIEISLLIELLDNFALSKEDIRKLAYAPDLKSRAYKYLAGLSNNADNLALLGRVINQQTSICAFFWKRRGLFYGYGFWEDSEHARSASPTMERIHKLYICMSIYVELPAQVIAQPRQLPVGEGLMLGDSSGLSAELRLDALRQGLSSRVNSETPTIPEISLASQGALRDNFELPYHQYKFLAGIAMGGVFLVLAVMLAIRNQEPNENNYVKLA